MSSTTNGTIPSVRRTDTILRPDQARVLLRPFNPGDPERIACIVARIMAIPEDQLPALIGQIRS